MRLRSTDAVGRDMYYRDPALFGKQAHVDRFVDDIAHTFGVSRSALNVTAVAKGLIAGAIKFCRRDCSILDASADREGLLMPSLRDILFADLSNVKWILVIEKEATFRSIASSTFWPAIASSGIIVTAKGYPDLATRSMLHFLTNPTPQNGFASPAVFALVDYDPDGLAIFSTYNYGSLGLAHESASINLPQLQWLGLRSRHITPSTSKTNELAGVVSGDNELHAEQGLLLLTPRDRRRAGLMLGWEVLAGAGTEEGADASGGQHIKNELRTMMMLGYKAELQLLDAREGAMTALLTASLPCV